MTASAVRRAARPSVRVGVEAHQNVRKSHRAKEGGDDDGQHLIQRMRTAQAAAGTDPLITGAGGAGDDRGGRPRGERDRGACAQRVLAGGGDPCVVHGPAVEGAADGNPVGHVHLDDDVGLDRDRGVLIYPRRQRATERRTIGDEQCQQRQGRDRDCGQFQPVLECLNERDGPHPAADYVGDDDRGNRHWPYPKGQSQKDVQRQTGTLVLGDEIEHADDDDEKHGRCAQPGRGEPEFGEVGHRVRAGTAQRRGDEHQQSEVAGGEADGVPQRVGAILGDQPCNAEKRCRREIFTGYRCSVPAGTDGAGGDQEVRRGPRQPSPVNAERHGGYRGGQKCRRGERNRGRPGHGSSSTTRTMSRSPCSASRT